MTPRQQECLGYVRSYWAEHAMAPLQVWISDKMGYKRRANGQANGGVSSLLQALERQDMVRITHGLARGVKPTGICPCCGRKHE